MCKSELPTLRLSKFIVRHTHTQTYTDIYIHIYRQTDTQANMTEIIYRGWSKT